MMARLMARGEQLARRAQEQSVERIAERLRGSFGRAVETGEAQVLVSGRGILKSWLVDPRLRFLSGEAT